MMIYDHTNPFYVKRRKEAGNNKYNGAYYYSRDIVKYIIPNVKTDRNWITVNLPELAKEHVNLDHSIIFIHNNLQPNAYQWLRHYNDLILVCGIPSTMGNVIFFGHPVYLPLSVHIASVKRYRKKNKTKEMAFAGRLSKINNHVPKECDILTGMPQTILLNEMSKYKKIYAVGRTAIQAKILGCEIGFYDERFPDARIWKILDCKDAALKLQKIIDTIDA
jgi:hypothetical protein